jgi:hypothetical protein
VNVLRPLFEKPLISREQALSIAETFCEKHGWAWRPKIIVKSKWQSWHIYTNYPNRGGNINIFVNKYTGQIMKATHARY